MANATSWDEIARGVLVGRFGEPQVNVGLVVGVDRCLVIDTGSTQEWGAEIARAVRGMTSLPWVVVNTHAHGDHCFGNVRFSSSQIVGHSRAVFVLRHYGRIQQMMMAERARLAGNEHLAAQVDAVRIVPPNFVMRDDPVRLDLGGETLVEVAHLGRGHTNNDIVVTVPERRVTFAGDLVEEGHPPVFADSFPLDWPGTLQRLVTLGSETFVPGHGQVVGEGFVEQQVRSMTHVARVAERAHAEGRTPEDVAGELSLPVDVAQQAVGRAYRQLEGKPAYDSPREIRAALGLTD